MIKIYTDSSFKKGVSTHHYRIIMDGKRVNRHTYLGSEENVDKAEAFTIVRALQRAYRKGLEGFVLYTDSMNTVQGVEKLREWDGDLDKVNDDHRYILHLLKLTNSTIEWKSRESHGIRKADEECRKLMKTKMKRVG